MKDMLTPVMEAITGPSPDHSEGVAPASADGSGTFSASAYVDAGGKELYLSGYQNPRGVVHVTLYDFNDELENSLVSIDSNMPEVIDMIPSVIRNAVQAYAGARTLRRASSTADRLESLADCN